MFDMAPIQSQSSYAIHGSSSNMNPSHCYCGSSILNDWEWWLPVSRRGHFFQDSFFEDARAHFDAAVKEVLSKWDDREIFNELFQQDDSSSFFDHLNRYRQLRSSNELEENQVTTLISDNNSHKVVMDVHDLMDGEIKVKVVGDKEVVVKGQGFGHWSSTTFSRRFCFPDTANMAAVTSVLSSDGVLTIEAPILSTTNNLGETPGTVIRSSKEDTKPRASAVIDGKEDEKVFYCKGCNKRIGPRETVAEPSVTHQEGMKIPIKINATVTKAFARSSASPISKFISNEITNRSDVDVVDEDVSHKMKNEETNFEVEEKKFSTEKNTSVTSENALHTLSSNNNYNVPISNCFTSLPIIKRGMFFNDSVFDDIRKDFQSAVQDVLFNWGEKSSVLDEMSSYRNLRSRDPREENQAVKVTEDNTNHKVVLDVHDFMNGGDITVKAINDRELMVEGRIEKQEQGSKTQKSFLKRFVLPGDIQLSSVTTVMSSDGVLTVTAPKKPQSAHLREFIIPISIEKVEDWAKGDHINTTQESFNERNRKNSSEADQDSFVSSVKKQSSHSSASNESNTTSSQRDSQSSVNKHKVISKPATELIIPIQVVGSCIKSNSEVVKNKREVEQYHLLYKATDSCENITFNGLQDTETSTDKEERNSNSMINRINFTLKQADKRQFANSVVKTPAAETEKPVAREISSAYSSTGRYLPIARRGTFYDDSFFEGYRKDFETAVSEVLVKSRENVMDGELINTYRNLRQRNLKVENQALRAHEDQRSFKVVLDVKDFTDGDITVSVDGEELLIEGRTEKTENRSSDSLNFSHRFLLPEATDFTAITSAISSDGVLTINSIKTGHTSGDAVRKVSSEAESNHESHNDGSHYWEKKNIKESSQQSKGYSSRTLCSSYHSKKQHSSLL